MEALLLQDQSLNSWPYISQESPTNETIYAQWPFVSNIQQDEHVPKAACCIHRFLAISFALLVDVMPIYPDPFYENPCISLLVKICHHWQDSLLNLHVVGSKKNPHVGCQNPYPFSAGNIPHHIVIHVWTKPRKNSTAFVATAKPPSWAQLSWDISGRGAKAMSIWGDQLVKHEWG